MPVDNVNAAPALSGEELKSASRAAMKELDKEAFLKLLIAQLSNQDPLNPMEDREFIAQMAQFSSLEQMTNMSKTLEKMAEADKYSAVSYVGKHIGFTLGEGEEAKAVMDKVVAVWFDPKKGTLLQTSAGHYVPLKQIEGVAPDQLPQKKS